MQGKGGVVLVTVMLLVLVLGMLARAAFVLGPAALALSESTREDEAAQHAADAGLAYARSKLLERQGWKGDDNRVTVSLPDFTVVEDNGNVIGLLPTPDGSLSQFRIRFNFQDGAAGGDGPCAGFERKDCAGVGLRTAQRVSRRRRPCPQGRRIQEPLRSLRWSALRCAGSARPGSRPSPSTGSLPAPGRVAARQSLC